MSEYSAHWSKLRKNDGSGQLHKWDVVGVAVSWVELVVLMQGDGGVSLG